MANIRLPALVALSLLAALAASEAPSYRDMTEQQLLSESVGCGAERLDRQACTAKPNCFYLEWYVSKVDSVLPFCFSYNEIMRYFFGNEQALQQNAAGGYMPPVSRNNFCAVVVDLKSFLDLEGYVQVCELSTAVAVADA